MVSQKFKSEAKYGALGIAWTQSSVGAGLATATVSGTRGIEKVAILGATVVGTMLVESAVYQKFKAHRELKQAQRV